jgi:hypothetical protein
MGASFASSPQTADLSSTKVAKELFTASVFVAAAGLIAYVLALFFWTSYCEFFKIPWYLVSPSKAMTVRVFFLLVGAMWPLWLIFYISLWTFPGRRVAIIAWAAATVITLVNLLVGGLWSLAIWTLYMCLVFLLEAVIMVLLCFGRGRVWLGSVVANLNNDRVPTRP